jgi:signal transduction histidine kinase
MADFFEPRAMEKSLKIQAILPQSLPLAMGDPERVRQVTSNLIHNAIKFTNKGGIVLWAKEMDGFIQVGVQDTGVGIPKDKLDAVFKKFECLKDTKDRVEKPVPGSGLGLNIVKNSLKAQGGKIWVESEIDKGSTFIFTLPLAPKEFQEKNLVSNSGNAEAMAVSPQIAHPRHPVMITPPPNGVKI